jgi:MoaA/NifB/PqqE/SkfB family radical SAM enzyme
MTTAENAQGVAVMNDLRFLWLEITAKCNLFCSHCYADSGPQGDLYGDMSYGDWARVIDEAAELGCRALQFIGGEPTMHPRLDDLVDHANHRGFDFIEVFTNATRVGKDLIGCFQRGGVHVATSFYSDDPAVHEQITQGKGSWQRTVHGIETVLAAGLPIRVGVIETERNAGHGPRAIEFLKGLGVQEVRMDRERGVGRGKLVRLGCEGERYEELCGECWKARLCVTSGGDVFPCVFSRATRLGDVRSGLSGILESAKLADFGRKLRSIHECSAPAPTEQRPGDHPESYGRMQNCSPCTPPCLPQCPMRPGCHPESCGPMQPCDPAPGTCTPNCNPPCAPLSCAPN